MPVPLTVAVPAALAGAAYINAKASIFVDHHALRSVIPSTASIFWRAYTARLNAFFRLEERAKSKAFQDHPFILFEDRRYTYSQAYDVVLRYGHWLKTTFDIKPGEIIAIDFQNTDNFVFLTFALWAIGAKPAYINYNLSGAALIHCVRRAGARLVFVDIDVAPNVSDDVKVELPGVKFEVFTREVEAQARASDSVRYPDEIRAEKDVESMAILIYTSGTTGLPKAAIVSWGKWVILGGLMKRLHGTTPSDIYYTAMPLYHSTASLMCLAHVLEAGATVALGRKFSTTRFWSDVRKYDATMIQYVGETCRYLLSAPPTFDPVTGENLDKKHRVRVAAGNGLRPDVWPRFKERFGIDTISEFYGATEGNFMVFNLSRNDFTMGAVGRNGWLYHLVAGRRSSVVEVDFETDLPYRDPKTGYCRRVKPGHPGELLFRLPNDVNKRFQGYFGDRGSTAKKVMRDVFHKGDVWFRTGDVVRWDNEGRVYFHDRLGDTFRWKSENVSTAEVAQVVGSHPAIAESNVYGVQLPGHEGRAGCAAIALVDDIATPSEELLHDFADFFRAGLPKYAVPQFLRVVKGTQMHTTGTNKQQKNALRDEGVDPNKTLKDEIYWLRGSSYVRFGMKEWNELNGGRVRL